MCGRYVIKFTYEEVRKQLNRLKPQEREILAMFNAAPTQSLPMVRPSSEDAAVWEMVDGRWGFIPSWAKPPEPGAEGGKVLPRPINARRETIFTSGMFKHAYAKTRCIVPASGYYEWQVQPDASKRPMYLTRADGEPLLMGGIVGADASFAIITTEAARDTAAIHNRTPVIIEPDSAETWFNLGTPIADLNGLCRPIPEGLLQWHTVAGRVGNVRNNDAALIERV